MNLGLKKEERRNEKNRASDWSKKSSCHSSFLSLPSSSLPCPSSKQSIMVTLFLFLFGSSFFFFIFFLFHSFFLFFFFLFLSEISFKFNVLSLFFSFLSFLLHLQKKTSKQEKRKSLTVQHDSIGKAPEVDFL